jgi:hypothetical protein
VAVVTASYCGCTTVPRRFAGVVRAGVIASADAAHQFVGAGRADIPAAARILKMPAERAENPRITQESQPDQG